MVAISILIVYLIQIETKLESLTHQIKQLAKRPANSKPSKINPNLLPANSLSTLENKLDELIIKFQRFEEQSNVGAEFFDKIDPNFEQKISSRLHRFKSDFTDEFNQLRDFMNQLTKNIEDSNEDAKQNLDNNYANWKIRLNSYRADLMQLRETMRFYLRESSIINEMPHSKSTIPSLTTTSPPKLPSNLSHVSIDGEIKALFPGYDFLVEKKYLILKSDPGDYYLFKNRDFTEFLNYSLTSLLHPNGLRVDSYFLDGYLLENTRLTGTLQKYFLNAIPIDQQSLQMLPSNRSMELFSYLLIDYLLGNSDRDFLFYPAEDRIIAVDVDDAFQYEKPQKIYLENSIYYSLCGLYRFHRDLPAKLAKEQLRLQSISELEIRAWFDQARGQRWEKEISIDDALLNLLARRKNLGGFIKEILAAMLNDVFEPVSNDN